MQHFLETLNPFGDMSDTDISNYLYNKSIEIEPRGCKQVPKFPRKWPHLPLKSPSSKTKSSRQSVSSSSSTAFTSPQQLKVEEGNKNEENVKSDNDFSVFAQVIVFYLFENFYASILYFQ